MYANGNGVPGDDVEAVKWFRLAADQDLTTHYGHHQNKGRSGSVDTMGLGWTGKGLISRCDQARRGPFGLPRLTLSRAQFS